MTINECKDKVAQGNGFKDWEDVLTSLFDGDILNLWPQATTLYAQEKVKEALRLAAERATLKIERDGKQVLKGTYAYFADDFDHVEIDHDSILSLETELLNKIEKE